MEGLLNEPLGYFWKKCNFCSNPGILSKGIPEKNGWRSFGKIYSGILYIFMIFLDKSPEHFFEKIPGGISKLLFIKVCNEVLFRVIPRVIFGDISSKRHSRIFLKIKKIGEITVGFSERMLGELFNGIPRIFYKRILEHNSYEISGINLLEI